MKKWSPWLLLLAGLSVLFFKHGGYWSATWYSKWALLIALFSLWVAFDVGKKTAWVFMPLVGYCLLNAASVGVYADNLYHGSADDLSLLALEHNSLYAYIVLLGSALFLANFPHRWRIPAATYLALVSLIGTVSTLAMPAGQPPLNGLYFGNPSMGAGLMAALLPFLWVVPLWPIVVVTWLLTAVAIWRTGTSIPVGILGVASAAYALSYFRPRVKVFAGIGALAVAMLGSGQFLLGKDFLDNNKRFDIWREILTWTHAHMDVWFGTRLGSGQILFPIIQTIDAGGTFRGDYFLWLHNDWLQMVVEMGYVGIALVLPVWGYLLWKSWGQPALFAAFSAFTVMGLMNYPLRLPIHSFCLLLIVCLIVKPFEARLASEW